MKEIKRSPFNNTYGRLSLFQDEKTKEYYLHMEDCFGPDKWGPLTDEQVSAFYILCEVEEI